MQSQTPGLNNWCASEAQFSPRVIILGLYREPQPKNPEGLTPQAPKPHQLKPQTPKTRHTINEQK